MLLSELIWYLNETLKEHGDMNVCLFSECFLDYSETIIVKEVKDGFYYNACEDKVKGDFLLLE